MSPDLPPIRDASTLILLRQTAQGPRVLMGQRGAGAVFMPSKFVFPGGAVDDTDGDVTFSAPINPCCARRLTLETDPARQTATPPALVAAALREVFEETGLPLGSKESWPCASGPACATPLHFMFRAITPLGRPRRFDARFFMADAAQIDADPDDFSRAEDELSHLHWVPLPEARALSLPFITEVVLAEISALIAKYGEICADPDGVPFFDNSTEIARFRRLI
ncbi:NUDIX domain-containing protein [Albirhodobacter sp. R86504]|uniref:NUDIX hydrolase n=1 Tax=Albirhodobacter sp. R86504 TaxID=3093848 RepID=UPI00366C8462